MAEQSKPINPFASLTSNPDVTETRKLFTAHFAGPDEGVIGKWDELWNLWPDAKNKGGEEVKLPFDKGVFNPALDEVLLKGLAGPAIDEVADGTPDGKVENVTAEKLQTVPEVEGTVEKDEQDIFAGPPENKRKPTDRQRKKSLVPGCGKGYDVLLLSAYGFDATGLEVSAKAIEEAEKFKTSVLTQEEEEEEEEEGGLYRIRDESIGRGEVSFLKGDFFGLGGEGYEEGSWDVVYDYTFLSALPPSLRPAWAATIYKLLKPGGKLICVEFPTYKEPSSGGPPWALPPEVYVEHLMRPGEEVEYDGDGRIVVSEEFMGMRGEKLEGGMFRRVKHYQPRETHEIGKGTDWVGVWERV